MAGPGYWRAAGCAALLWAAAGAALAQEPAPVEGVAGGVIPFTPDFFTQFQPANALDMVNRIPGFSFNAGEQVRGFQGAVGNVLIDGQRPSSKSVTLDALLARIPAGQVERIDLIRGGAPGIDMQGLPILANVIRKPGAGLTGAVEFGVKGYAGHRTGPLGKLQLTRKSGGLTLDGTVTIERADPESDANQSGVAEGRQTRRDGLGRITSFGRTQLSIRNNLYQANGSAEYRRGKDLYHLNLGLERLNQPRREDSDLQTPARVRFRELLDQWSRADKAEIGADYERQLGRGASWQVVALHTYKFNDLVSTFATPAATTVSTRRATSGESIARTSIQGVTWRGVGFAAGAEAALNTLDSTSGLIVGGVAQSLPSANVRVEEKRAEGFVTASAKPTSKTSLELGLRVETSTISQSGDVDRSRSFTFAKPRAIFTWSPGAGLQLRLRAERVVGQLNFESFAASGDLILGAAAGNTDLQPERAWLFEGAVEKRFWGQGVAILAFTHRELRQVNDRVAIFTPTGVFDAPGNIDRGTRDELKTTLVVPLDRLGLKNTQIRNINTYRMSKVIDPVTGRPRQIAGIQNTIYEAYVTRDFPKWRSTLTFGGRFGFHMANYRLVERRVEKRPVALDANWVWKMTPDWQLRVAVENPFPKLITRDRDTYTPTRAGSLVQEEDRRLFATTLYTVRFRRTF
jgi:hypothetical protein